MAILRLHFALLMERGNIPGLEKDVISGVVMTVVGQISGIEMKIERLILL